MDSKDVREERQSGESETVIPERRVDREGQRKVRRGG